jgi:carbon storage regulator
MLVLSRKVGERVLIGEEIVLQVLEASGQRIRLGIEAPIGVGIWREELTVDTFGAFEGPVHKSR